jgi:hypothetical protein
VSGVGGGGLFVVRGGEGGEKVDSFYTRFDLRVGWSNKRVIEGSQSFRRVTQDLGAGAITPDSTMSLFTPDDPHGTSRLFRFLREVNEKQSLNLESYRDLYEWSTSNIDLFWSHVWDHTEITGSKGGHVVDATATPAKNPAWFSDSVVNFAENLLRDRSPDTIAIVQVCTLS